MMTYPRTSSTNSSGFFEDDETYQSPSQSPANTPQYLHRNIVRMFSSEDSSGTSAVAIDNKIEQAMDLVKSHLMIAVREEVEVLKEKISELMDKINQLEVENTLLKANMSQEMLKQLQMQIAAAPAQQQVQQPTQPAQQQVQQQPAAAPQQSAVVTAAAVTTAQQQQTVQAVPQTTAQGQDVTNGQDAQQQQQQQQQQNSAN